MLNQAQQLLNGFKCINKAVYSFVEQLEEVITVWMLYECFLPKIIELVDRKTVEVAIERGNHRRSASRNKCVRWIGNGCPREGSNVGQHNEQPEN